MRCKMKLSSITRRAFYTYQNGQRLYSEVQDLNFHAVCDGSDENKAFFASTPSGEFKVSTVNGDAVAALVLDGEYYIDITPAG